MAGAVVALYCNYSFLTYVCVSETGKVGKVACF